MGHGQRVKHKGTNGKFLSQGIPRWNKALALTVQKLLARLKFSKTGSWSRSQGKIYRSNHREYVKYQSSSSHCWKVISMFKVSGGGQNYRMKEEQNGRQEKNNIPPIFDLGGLNINNDIWKHPLIQCQSICCILHFHHMAILITVT